MTLDLPPRESVSEAYEVGPVVETRIGDALWRLSAKRCLAPPKPKAWRASYERRAWINIDGVATWHWVSEHRLPLAEGESAEECLDAALSVIDDMNSRRALQPTTRSADPGTATAGADPNLAEQLAGRLARGPATQQRERAR